MPNRRQIAIKSFKLLEYDFGGIAECIMPLYQFLKHGDDEEANNILSDIINLAKDIMAHARKIKRAIK